MYNTVAVIYIICLLYIYSLLLLCTPRLPKATVYSCFYPSKLKKTKDERRIIEGHIRRTLRGLSTDRRFSAGSFGLRRSFGLVHRTLRGRYMALIRLRYGSDMEEPRL
jgi:hypothetical protein